MVIANHIISGGIITNITFLSRVFRNHVILYGIIVDISVFLFLF